MQQRLIQIVGLVVTAVYAVVIVWLYATEPRSFKEVTTGAEVASGTYQVDEYAFYSEEWGRVYYDRDLFKQGVEAVNRAIALAPGPLTVPDDNLQLHTAAELKAELEQGTERSWGDTNHVFILPTRFSPRR